MPFQYDAFDQRIGVTNAPLTVHESNHVTARLYKRRHQLRGIDYTLASHSHADRGKLLEDRSKIVELTTRYQVALAPHKKLPTELLQTIFQLVCAGYNQDPPMVQAPPLLLGQVCPSWRSIITKTMPELWNSLHFSADSTYTSSQKLKVAQLWFSRAGTLDLSLTLADSVEEMPPRADFVKDLISPYSRRFRYLHLVLSFSQLYALFSLPLGSMEALEEFHAVHDIRHTPSLVIPPWPTQINFISPTSTSRLRGIRLHLTPFIDPTVFLFPWHCLESFRCDSSISCESCHSLLLSCQSLKKLHIRVFGIKYSVAPLIQIHLPNLSIFSVQLCDEESYDIFFLPLVLPALRSLSLYNYNGLPWSPGMYNGLLERSGCEIEELHLGTINVEAPDVLRLLERSTTLKSITFSHNTPLTPEIFIKIGQAELGASLVELFLKGTRNLDDILGMLETRYRNFPTVFDIDGRWSTSSPLKFVETHCLQDDIVTHSARVQHLQKGGVHISLLPSSETYFHL